MSFDPKSLKRLRELGRTLPQSLPIKENLSSFNKKTTSKSHPIETEQDPKKLFKELIKASKNGQIPSHLINRLKSLETKELEGERNIKSNSPEDLGEKDLYVDFNRLLLEEE